LKDKSAGKMIMAGSVDKKATFFFEPSGFSERAFSISQRDKGRLLGEEKLAKAVFLLSGGSDRLGGSAWFLRLFGGRGRSRLWQGSG